MLIYGRRIAAFMACLILLLVSVPAYPSYNSEAGRKYSVASQRLSELRKSPAKKKYRSYWIDCIRTFEVVEKKYPRSPSAGDACFERAAIYSELYQYTKLSSDVNTSIEAYGKCQADFPKHVKAAQGLFRSVELSLSCKNDRESASNIYAKLESSYPRSVWTGRAKALLGPAPRNKLPQQPEKKVTVPETAKEEKKGQFGVIKNIRHWSEGAYTRIVIDQTKPVKFQAQELKKPEHRLVFDIANSRIGKRVSTKPITINDGILKQVRVSQYAPDTVRVVLDLASIKSYASFPLRAPDRLVIDVTGEGGISSAQTVSAPTATVVKTKTLPPQTEQKKNPPDAAVQGTDEGAEARLTLSRQMGLKIKTIAIDAGHGGHDPGAIGKSGLQEKEITLDIAKRLAVLVTERLGCTVVMTRDRDVFIPLDQRPFIAKSHNADLFVSVHVNANRKRLTRGVETYVQGLKASDREAMATAARENAMSERSLGELDSEVDKMLKDLKVDNKIEESIQLAGTVQASLIDTMKPVQHTIVNHGVKSAFFYVLMNTNIPSILAEVGFISNADEEKLLGKESYRQKLAEALFEGVKKYVESRSPQSTIADL